MHSFSATHGPVPSFDGCRLTIHSQLDLLGSISSSVGRCADKLSGLISRRGVEVQAAVSVQGEVGTTQVQQLSALQKQTTAEKQ